MEQLLVKYRNKISEILEEYSHSLHELLRNIFFTLKELIPDDSSLFSHVQIGDQDYMCKGTPGPNLIVKLDIEVNGQKGFLELWTEKDLKKVFDNEQDKKLFFEVIEIIKQLIKNKQSGTVEFESDLEEISESEKLKLSFYKVLQDQLLKQYSMTNYYERDTSFDLMKYKVKEILLIATLYDAFSLESEGNFSKQIFGEYSKLNLSSPPRITAVSSYKEAYLNLRQKHYDMVIIMVGLDRETPLNIAKRLHSQFPFIPIYFLLNNNAEISFFLPAKEQKIVNNIFVWNGDSRVFLTMIKLQEDWVNVENDTQVGNVRVILLVEDSPRYYSRYLPLLYSNVYRQIQHVIDQVVAQDEVYKIYALRMRPKILLATSYEEALWIFNRYKNYFLSLITDVEFSKDGKKQKTAGIELAQYVAKNWIAEIPIIIQSSEETYKDIAENLGFHFINKNSITLADDINQAIREHMGFGDFIFRDETGRPIGYRARNLDEFIKLIEDPNKIPGESLMYHARRNHFSLWLTAQGEVKVAFELAQLNIEDFAGPDEIREFLIKLTNRIRYKKNMGKIVDFIESELDNPSTIVSLDSGALGGKGRGIAFIHTLFYRYGIIKLFDDINIKTPATFIIGSDQYDKFLENNKLKKIAFDPNVDYIELKKAFLNAKLTFDLFYKLRRIVKKIRKPLAVRSSGLLEDSLYQSFAGVYETYIVPNSDPDENIRVTQLANAIKMVYASVFSPKARSYINSINYRIEEEKMAIVIQEVVGRKFENYYYPHISGVAQSYNYYPFSHIKPEDGYATIALGLGTYVVEGERAYHFCPKYPKLQNYVLKDLLENSQTHFYAVDLQRREINFLKGENAALAKLDLWIAEKHGTLKHLASVYDMNGDRLIPGIDYPGPRVLDFADILKYNYIPLAQTITKMLDIAKEAMGIPVEIEFAVDLTKDENLRASFYLLQMKPLLGAGEDYEVDLQSLNREKLILFTDKSMGNGKIDYLKHVVFVDPQTFNKLYTEDIAEQIGKINEMMISHGLQYVLIGPGRWGTRDKWIGIPVYWGQISNAKIIVETSLENFPLQSSYGSHFFHHVISMNVGYFTVLHDNPEHLLRWDKLREQKIIYQTDYVKVVEFDEPFVVRMDGKKRIALIEEK